nr:hypothetical protein [Limnohabitans sp.]
MDYTRLLNALPQAKAAYGDGSSNGPASVGTWNVTETPGFKPETTNFQAGFYKDSTSGLYRVGFSGSNDREDWTRANANLAVGNWTPEATDSIRFVAAALKEIKNEVIRVEGDDGLNTSLPRLMEKLDTTVGHSQGGAWAELNRAFWGGNAVNIDGPGVGALLNKPEFAALKSEMQKEFPDLAREAFTSNDGSMQSYAFSKIGLTGDHVGSTVQATADAKVVDLLTDFPIPPLMAQQAAIGGLHTALTHRIDAIEAQAKAGALVETSRQIEDAFNQADQTAADIKAKYPDTTQISDSRGDLPDTSAHTNTNTHTFSNYLDTQGNTLNSKQQDALAAQIDKLGLGGDKELSFYSMPNGGAIIANADGDIVGEINRGSTGDLNLKATTIDASGNTVEVNQHISEQGSVQTQGEYNAQAQAQASNLFNSVMAVNNWSHLSDVGKLSALVNLYNATDKLGEAFGATGNNLPGDLGAAAGWLSLAQGIQSGDNLVIANGLNTVSGGAVDQAIGNMMGQELPYVSTLLELRNFADHPEQSAGTIAGTYIGQALGAEFGPVGVAICGAIGGLIGGTLGDIFGHRDPPPPPPAGLVHFSWDANGHIQHTIDFNQTGGADAANSVAARVQTLLEHVLQAVNDKNPSHADDVALNPYLIPKVGVSGGYAWLEISLPDGSTVKETIYSQTIATRLIEVLQHNGGLAPAWQVETEQIRWQHAQAQVQELEAQRDALLVVTEVQTDDGLQIQKIVPTEQEARYAELSAQTEQAQHRLSELAHGFKAGIGGHAYVGDQAYSLQGNAVESADFKSQSFGALVVHINQHVGVQQSMKELHETVVKTSEVLRDVENDGYFEKTQWVSATDVQGNLQGVLTLDLDGNAQIDTRDILNLGGNTSQGNPTDEAKQANQNAALQHNNVQWLDANGDGVLDKRDPAFAAIRLWVDVNQDGQMQAGEGKSLASQSISSINFKTGEVTYANGHIDALTATTLKADTEGVKLAQIQEVNPDGTLHTLDAGAVLEHEGYQGKVQITDEGGTRWASVREQTYEQQAKRIGDWEGTPEQDAHRHGGGNVAGAPTETTATGAISFGPVKTVANVITQSTIAEGDERVVSDAPTQAPQQASVQANAQVTITAGDSRLKSSAVLANATTAASTSQPLYGQVSLVNGEVLFAPDANYSARHLCSMRHHARCIAGQHLTVALEHKVALFVRGLHHIIGDTEPSNATVKLKPLVLRAVFAQQSNVFFELNQVLRVALVFDLNQSQAIAVDQHQIDLCLFALSAHRHMGKHLVELEITNHRFLHQSIVEKLFGLITTVVGHAAVEFLQGFIGSGYAFDFGGNLAQRGLRCSLSFTQTQKRFPQLGGQCRSAARRVWHGRIQKGGLEWADFKSNYNKGSGKEKRHSTLATSSEGLMPRPTAILKTELRLGTCCPNSKMDTKFRSTPAANPSFSWDKPCSRRNSRTTSPNALAKVNAGGLAMNRWALVMPTIVRKIA